MLVDSSVVVDIDRGGVDDRVATLDAEGRHAISAVTVTELRLGVNRRYDDESEQREDALLGLERLLARFDVFDVTRSVAARAGDVVDDLRRRGEPLHDLHDVYIAATALTEQLPVLTANVDHFERVEGLTVVDWHDY
jgi:predicted nucleic acid-binding protein